MNSFDDADSLLLHAEQVLVETIAKHNDVIKPVSLRVPKIGRDKDDYS